MMTKIEVNKTYWIGISANQKADLLGAVLIALAHDIKPDYQKDLTSSQFEALEALRLALLNT